MEIRRDEFFEMFRFEEYIKSKCKYADRVYSNAIYFSDNHYNYISWNETLMIDKDRMDWFLKGFNAMLGTDFEFID